MKGTEGEKGAEGGESTEKNYFYHRDTEGTEFTETKREKGIP
jgi:hypothetical protein